VDPERQVVHGVAAHGVLVVFVGPAQWQGYVQPSGWTDPVRVRPVGHGGHQRYCGQAMAVVRGGTVRVATIVLVGMGVNGARRGSIAEAEVERERTMAKARKLGREDLWLDGRMVGDEVRSMMQGVPVYINSQKPQV